MKQDSYNFIGNRGRLVILQESDDNWPLWHVFIEEQDNAGCPASSYSPTGTHIVAESQDKEILRALKKALEKYNFHSCWMCKAGRTIID